MLVRLIIYTMLLLACIAAGEPSGNVSFVAFGDSGYHYDYIKKKVLNKKLSPEEYQAEEYASWLEKYLPKNEFKAPPMYIMPETNQAIEASGAEAVAEAMYNFCNSSDCHFAIMLGDNIYPKGATGKEDEIRFKKIFSDPYHKLTQHRPNFKMYAALGNHDWKTSRIGRNLQVMYGERADTAFTMFSPGYYKYTKGDVDFFVIDTNLILSGMVVNEDALNPDGSELILEEIDEPEAWEVPNNEDAKQIQWLKESLKNSQAKWKVVYGHHTLWSAGGSKFTQARALRQTIMPILCKYADIYLAGHEHELEINIDTCQSEIGTAEHPLPLVISGAGSMQRPVHHPFQSFQEINNPQYKALWSKGMVWGFSHIKISKDEMIVKMVSTPDNASGKVAVEKTISFKNRSQIIKNLEP